MALLVVHETTVFADKKQGPSAHLSFSFNARLGFYERLVDYFLRDSAFLE